MRRLSPGAEWRSPLGVDKLECADEQVEREAAGFHSGRRHSHRVLRSESDPWLNSDPDPEKLRTLAAMTSVL
jgi:hypothetical protein